MPRLIDQLRTGGRLAAPGYVDARHDAAWERIARKAIQLLGDPLLPVLLIDNVADYYYTGSDQEYWDLTRDFPNLAPPYPIFWAEHRLPKRVHSAECGDTSVAELLGKDARLGVLVVALDPASVTVTDVPPEIERGAKWYLWCEIFIDYGRDRDVVAHGPHGSIFLVVDEHGALLGKPWMQALCRNDDELAREELKGYMTWLNPTFLAMSFLHCKNVRVEDHAMDRPLAKKFRAKHNAEPVRWKTLVIEPLREILRTEGKAQTNGLAKAMHICRGHFRDYREGRGLFGKYHQLVWQPSIVRGTKGKQPPPREMDIKV